MIKLVTVKKDIGYFAGSSEEFFDVGTEDTAKAAAQAYFEDNEDETSCYVGRGRTVSFEISGESFLEALKDDLYDELGEQIDGWPKKVSSEELGNIVTTAVKSFLGLKGERLEWDLIEGAELVFRKNSFFE